MFKGINRFQRRERGYLPEIPAKHTPKRHQFGVCYDPQLGT